MKKVLVTGGAGYKGCILVPKLLKAGYSVVVYDLMLFGDEGLPKHPNLTVVKGDIRDIPAYTKALEGCDSVIHMACISNDPSFDLDPSLSRTINYECFEPLVVASKEAGVVVNLAWRYAKPIIAKHAEYLTSGGKFLKVLPEMEYYRMQ